jgi:hypothetical protein
MTRFHWIAAAWACGTVCAEADVYYVEEVINSGLGASKRGARKTINKVYIKGREQKVESTIEAGKETVRTLRKQGQSLDTSTILKLDDGIVYNIDRMDHTFRQQKLPAAKPVAGRPAPASGAPEITFRIKELPDTTRIAGILCRRVAAEMRARYYKPGTRKLRQENRYLYQAWIGRDFPGYGEIRSFQELHLRTTSYPPLISGSLDQLKGLVDDYEDLAAEIDKSRALDGFVLGSTLKVYTRGAGGKEKQIFQLSRKVKSFSSNLLPDSLFEMDKTLRRVKN